MIKFYIWYKISILIRFILLFVLPISVHAKDVKYDRKAYGYKTVSYPMGVVSFYQKNGNCVLEADHVVSLHDAHNSGAWKFNITQKRAFANDIDNIVPACRSVNRSKGNRTPKDFLRVSMDTYGVEVDWTHTNFCSYIKKYVRIKKKYDLSFANNDIDTLKKCIDIL